MKKCGVILLIFACAAFITYKPTRYAPVSVPSKNEKANELLQALYELELPSSEADLLALNEELATLNPTFILRWANHALLTQQHLRHNKAHHPMIQVTSFGPTGLVILHMLSTTELLKEVPVVTMDTLHLFQESYAFYDTIKQHPYFANMDLTVTKPIGMDGQRFTSRDEFDKQYPWLWNRDPKRYTKYTKQDPLEEVFQQGVEMWITGRRRSQGGERTNMQILEFEYNKDASEGSPYELPNGRWKLNPLAFWTYDQVWNYIRKHEIPYNPLYDQGYTSLGDEMTTRLPDLSQQNSAAYERSGRFVGLNQTECGLHSHRAKVNAKKKEAADAGEDWKVPELKCNKCIDLDVTTFDTFIRNGKGEVLLEFYSPYCGGCQEFAPTMNRLAEQLSSGDTPMTIARFDITEHDPPLIGNDKLFEVEATPTLYRVKYPLNAELYTGQHDYHAIMKWIGKY